MQIATEDWRTTSTGEQRKRMACAERVGDPVVNTLRSGVAEKDRCRGRGLRALAIVERSVQAELIRAQMIPPRFRTQRPHINIEAFREAAKRIRSQTHRTQYRQPGGKCDADAAAALRADRTFNQDERQP